MKARKGAAYNIATNKCSFVPCQVTGKRKWKLSAGLILDVLSRVPCSKALRVGQLLNCYEMNKERSCL
jgi:hypothetical protein